LFSTIPHESIEMYENCRDLNTLDK